MSRKKEKQEPYVYEYTRELRKIKPVLNEPTKIEQNEVIISLYEDLVKKVDSVFQKGNLTKYQKQTLTKMIVTYLVFTANV